MKTILSLWCKKTDAVLLAALFLTLFLFYPELFTARMAMLTGDHEIQHYPWAVLLSSSLKHFRLPFWTSAIHCGFPITAEGQIGSFYPPNLIFMGLLSPEQGYSYLHVFHFLLAGWGMYGYTRAIKLSPLGAFFAAFVYLFGTVYGGAYYNITSLKTLTWFPWLLLFFECFDASGKKRFILGIALAAAFAVLAGYLQIAVYALGMFVVYILIRLWLFPSESGRSFRNLCAKNAWVFSGLAAGVTLAIPQLMLTFDLAMRSTRAAPVEDYAYIGSMFPAALATFFYPMLQGLFRGNSLYLGMTVVWLVPIGFFCREVRRTTFFKVWALFAFFSVLLSLGQWSPLYVLLIKLTHFYSFRTPAKFLFFICFSLSVLAGMGWDRLRVDIQNGFVSAPVQEASRLYVVFFAATLAGIATLTALLSNGGVLIQKWGYAFVEKSFFGKMGHPHTLADYHQKWDDSMQSVLRTIDLANPWNAAVLGLMLVGGLMALTPFYKKKIGNVFLAGLLLFTAADLYLFSWNDIRRDFAPYAASGKSSITQELLREKAAGQVGRIYGFRSPEESLPLVPSENMFYGLEDIGAYSPFVTRRYLETVGLLGNVDDSNGLLSPSVALLEKNLSLLNFMNVSHLLSAQPLNLPGWILKTEETAGLQHYYLYLNQNHHAKAHFVPRAEIFAAWADLRGKWLSENKDPSQVVYFEKSEWQKMGAADLPAAGIWGEVGTEATLVLQDKSETDEEVWQVTARRTGFFVRSVLYEPQWSCDLNGREVPVLAAHGLFQAVRIPASGTYQLRFHYHPFLKSKA